MFTGLIEEIGTVNSIANIGGAIRLSVKAKNIFDDLKIDDSVSINGVCQTVVKIQNNVFEVEAVEETLKKTNFSTLRTSQKVNLERAIKLSSRLGGHIVQGHTDCTGKVLKILKEQTAVIMFVSFPSVNSKYIIPVGSICINGVSLTVAKKDINSLSVSIIPHTWNNTTLSLLNAGDSVNLEFDLIGKYVENMLKDSYNSVNSEKSILNQYISQPF